VEWQDLAAAVSDVPEAEFEEGPLNQLMGNMAWLGERAAVHQLVNAQLFALADALLPLSFGTVYRAPDSVARLLQAQRSDLQARLDAVRERAEWVLTLRKDAAAQRSAVEQESPALAELRREIAAAAPGRAYLLSRRTDELVRQEAAVLDLRAAQAMEALAERDGARVYPEQVANDAELTQGGVGAGGRAIARSTVLLPRGAPLAEWCDAFNGEWRSRGYSLEATGPWPPYRSAGAPPREDAAEGRARR